MGLLFLLMLFIPNVLWTRRQPEGYTSDHESRILKAFERIGEVLTSCCALVFSDFNVRTWTPWSLWLVAALALMFLYEVWWLRYFRGARNEEDMYSSIACIPVAGATLPVAAFFLLGMYGRVIWMLIADTILGIGHIGIHIEHRKALGSNH